MFLLFVGKRFAPIKNPQCSKLRVFLSDLEIGVPNIAICPIIDYPTLTADGSFRTNS